MPLDFAHDLSSCELETMMRIDLRPLLSGAENVLEVPADLDLSVIDNGLARYEIAGKNPFVLMLTRIGKTKIHVTAEGFVVVNIPCDRCLETVPTTVEFHVDTEVDMEQAASGEEAQEEKDYVDGYNLDVDRLIFDEILLSMPGKTLCKEDCKGLCLVCGANLNVADCGCDRSVMDPRMSVFKDILNNIKEV